MHSGVQIVEEMPGAGGVVERRRVYRIRLRMWLLDGTPVRWQMASGPVGRAALEDEGHTLLTEVRLHRGSLINGLFYGMEGMRVGGTRKLEMAPHMAYADRGVPGSVPPGAGLVAEVTVLEERPWPPGPAEGSGSRT
jgi:hypothetical protein